MPNEVKNNQKSEENIVEELIENSIKIVVSLKSEIDNCNFEINKIKIVYPKYRETTKEEKELIKDGKQVIYKITKDIRKRVSEQEIKQIFIQLLNEENRFLYSVETPTFSEHHFLGVSPRSGNIDVCLYVVNDKKIKRKFLLEFKANNKGSYENDFNKLANGSASEEKNESIDTFFIHIVEPFHPSTKNAIIRDYKAALEHFKNSKNNLTIYLITLRNTHESRKENAINTEVLGNIKYYSLSKQAGYYKIKINKKDNKNIGSILDEFINNNYESISGLI